MWNENDGDKGASNIISCLNKYMQPLINKYIKFNIFCDGYGGQNKNKFLITYLSDLAYKNNIKIRINFPVTGHSFMPIDKSFGRVKKLIKRKDPIISINEYYLLFSEVGKVWKYREDFVFSDWKLFLKNIKINKGVEIRNLRQINFFETSIQYYYKANKIEGIVQSCVSELAHDNLEELEKSQAIYNNKKSNIRNLLTKLGVNNDEKVREEFFFN